MQISSIREVIHFVPFKRVNYKWKDFSLDVLHLIVTGLVVDVLLAPVCEEHVELSLFRNKVQIPIEF